MKLLVCCSVLWVVVSSSSSSRVRAPPPGCASMLEFSSSDSSSSGGDIHSRSVSPWRWRSSTEKNRIPSTLWEAQCSSSSCSGLTAGQTNGHHLNSVPIYQNILVLTRQGPGRCYTTSYRSVAVGCTCVWARTNHN